MAASLVAPLRAEPLEPNDHWVYGGRYVWETTDGRDTRCSAIGCDWKILHGVGAKNGITALDVNGDTIYAGWCGPIYCDPGPDFASGIDTNAGGEWHRVAGPGITNGGVPLPNRWITAIAIDPTNPNHVYVVYGGYRRHWNFVPGSGGHVFESTDGGETWSDASGDLPDDPANDLLIVVDGRLVVAMDVGVFVAEAASPDIWSNLGVGMPHALHAGEATRAGSNYTGMGVHTAARIGAEAGAGEIVASVSSVDGLELIDRRSVTLKGIAEPNRDRLDRLALRGSATARRVTSVPTLRERVVRQSQRGRIVA